MLLYLALDRGVALLGLPGSDLSVQVPEPLSVCLSVSWLSGSSKAALVKEADGAGSILSEQGSLPICREPLRKPHFLLGETWAACAPQIL